YFIGNDPKKWHAGVRQYAKVHYSNVYPGIDLVYYGKQRQLEYDFVLKPGADPNVIRVGIEGASQLRRKRGDLVLSSPVGDVHLRRPRIYQWVNGTKRAIHGHYVLKNKNELRFQVDAYDGARTLIIDPVLAYSTYLGDSSGTVAYAIAVDPVDN